MSQTVTATTEKKTPPSGRWFADAQGTFKIEVTRPDDARGWRVIHDDNYRPKGAPDREETLAYLARAWPTHQRRVVTPDVVSV